MKFSLCNYNWKLDEHDVVNTRRLEIKHNISPLLARCMMPIMNKLHREALRDSNQKNLAQHNPPQDIFQSLKSTLSDKISDTHNHNTTTTNATNLSAENISAQNKDQNKGEKKAEQDNYDLESIRKSIQESVEKSVENSLLNLVGNKKRNPSDNVLDFIQKKKNPPIYANQNASYHSETPYQESICSLDISSELSEQLLYDPLHLSDYWFEPSIEHLHDPYLMRGMIEAEDRIRKAIRNRERVRIVTDYDVDGTTSSLILQAMMKILYSQEGVGEQEIQHKRLLDYHIPDRFGEGYGFSVIAAKKAIQDKVDLIVTADIGIRDFEAIEVARNGGLDVLVCDHHLPAGESVPKDANVVLCPPQYGCKYPNPALAACGVSLKVAQTMLQKTNNFDTIFRSLMKLAAIGTIADVVSLSTLENRAIVSMGIQAVRDIRNGTGLQALLDVSGCSDGLINSSKIAFNIAPRINAAGRLDLATTVVELLNCKKPDKARQIAGKIDTLNRERRQIQQDLVERGRLKVRKPIPYFVTVFGKEEDGWHRGVVGIVASKLRDQFHRPTAVISINGNSGRASVRGTSGIHVLRALESVSDLLTRYGGHKAAAGFDVPVENIEELEKRLNQYVIMHLTEDALLPELSLRAQCSPRDIDLQFANDLQKIGPFGKDNPSPILLMNNVKAERLQVIGKNHLKFWIDGKEAIWWNSIKYKSDLEKLIKQGRIDIAMEVDINRYQQRSRVQMIVRDVRAAHL